MITVCGAQRVAWGRKDDHSVWSTEGSGGKKDDHSVWSTEGSGVRRMITVCGAQRVAG